jgi:uncharacterized metal-binding protein
MTSGINHDRGILAVGTLLAIATTQTPLPYDGFLIGGFLWGGWFASPDVDTISKSSKRLPIWWAYRAIFKHRGISHTLLLGTLTRVVYCLPLLFLLWYNGASLGAIAFLLIGWELSAWVHYFQDGIL